MKLHYITHSRIPTEKAHGVQVMHMCEAFADRGIETTLLVPRRFNKRTEDSFTYYGVRKNFSIKRLFTIDLFPIEKLIGRLAYWINLWSFHERLFLYFLFAKRDKVIYTRDILMTTFTALGYNVYYECHAIPEKRRNIFFKLARLATGIVTISSGLKEALVQEGLDAHAIFVAQDGVSIARFSGNEKQGVVIRKKLKINDAAKVVGYIGKAKTMGKHKGIEYLVEAVAIARKKDPDTILLLVGIEDDAREEIATWCDEYGLDKDGYRIVGHVSPTKVPHYMEATDIATVYYPDVLHYRRYMSPLKLFEYMASGKLIVAANLPSLTEVLNTSNAILVEPDNPRALAEAIMTVGHNDMRAKQAEKDVAQYTWESRAREIKRFINI